MRFLLQGQRLKRFGWCFLTKKENNKGRLLWSDDRSRPLFALSLATPIRQEVQNPTWPKKIFHSICRNHPEHPERNTAIINLVLVVVFNSPHTCTSHVVVVGFGVVVALGVNVSCHVVGFVFLNERMNEWCQRSICHHMGKSKKLTQSVKITYRFLWRSGWRPPRRSRRSCPPRPAWTRSSTPWPWQCPSWPGPGRSRAAPRGRRSHSGCCRSAPAPWRRSWSEGSAGGGREEGETMRDPAEPTITVGYFWLTVREGKKKKMKLWFDLS